MLATDLAKNTEVLNFTRYTFMLSPAIYLLLALAILSLKRSYQGIILGVLLITNFLIISPYYRETYKLSQWKEAALFIQQKVQRDDLLIIYNPSGKDWMTSAWLQCLGRYLSFRDHPFLLLEDPQISRQTLWHVSRFERGALVAVPDIPIPIWLAKACSIKDEASFVGVGKVAVFNARDLALGRDPQRATRVPP